VREAAIASDATIVERKRVYADATILSPFCCVHSLLRGVNGLIVVKCAD
jgi:hypothetical protein